MNKMGTCLAVAAGILLSASAEAQTRRGGISQRPGIGRSHFNGFYGPFGQRFGGWFGRPWFGSGFGFGVGLGASRRNPIYRNAFTGDVAYAEQSSNEFRAALERRRDAPRGLKTEVQRLDETLERLRREAEAFGGVTIRGTELLRDALSRADGIDREFRGEDDLSQRWSRLQSVLDSLARTYRVE